jgi:TonB family protein
MPTAVSELELASRPDVISVDGRATSARPTASLSSPTEESLLLKILTTSVVVHLLLVGFLGSGIPRPLARAPRPAAAPVTSAKLIEEVKLQEEEVPPEPPKPVDQDRVVPAPELPAAAQIDLPPINQVEPISAVPASVPVAFGLEVKGRVRLVSDASQAAGALGGRALQEPVAIDGDSSQEKNLLLPEVAYPPEALVRRQQGSVILEFRTSATGEISAVKVRQSSGYPAIDRAALKNLGQGRWKGSAGYYLKTYEFKLN